MITINTDLAIPKYKQIIFSIENAILSGDLKKGDQIPSINAIKSTYKLSRDTILMALNDLKNRGIIQSVIGKGYYVKSENVAIKQKILLLFDELNTFKEDLYNAFISNLDASIKVDIYFHHFNPNMFRNILENNIGDYHYYVVMPANLKDVKQVIEKLPSDTVYILDQMPKNLQHYSGIFQNFKKDIFNSLSRASNAIKKYKKLYLVFTKEKQPLGMLEGFKLFCDQNNMPYDILENLDKKQPEHGELYIIPDDDNLLRIIKKIKDAKLKLAKDVGIISYNDTLLKEIVEGGITTISTDFSAMGMRLARMISNREQNRIENTNNLILRHSL